MAASSRPLPAAPPPLLLLCKRMLRRIIKQTQEARQHAKTWRAEGVNGANKQANKLPATRGWPDIYQLWQRDNAARRRGKAQSVDRKHDKMMQEQGAYGKGGGEGDSSLLRIPCKGLSLTACAETMALRSLNHAQHVCGPQSVCVCVYANQTVSQLSALPAAA